MNMRAVVASVVPRPPVQNNAGGSQLSDVAPQPPGAASAGTGTKASRGDHVHAPPTPGQIGAEQAGAATSAVAAHAATADAHTIAGVSGLQAALDAKAQLASPALTGTPTAPTPSPGTNNTTLATTAFVATANAQRIPFSAVDAPGGVAGLDGAAKLSPSVLPDLAITQTFVTASQAAMLALTCQQGDVCVRTDLSKSFILVQAPPSTLANWQELLTPIGNPGTVTSVGLASTTGLTASGGPVTSSGTMSYTLSVNLLGWNAISPASKADTAHTHTLSNLSQSGAATGQAIVWNGTAWAPAAAPTPSNMVTTDTGQTITGEKTFDVTNTASMANSWSLASDTTSYAPTLRLTKRRTSNSPWYDLNTTNTRLGAVVWAGMDNAGVMANSASIDVYTAEPYLSSQHGSWMAFCTTAIGQASRAQRWVVQDSGNFIPADNNFYDLGASARTIRNLYLNSQLNIAVTTTPASATATGVKGTIVWDAGYIYVCVATNTWKRAALSSW